MKRKTLLTRPLEAAVTRADAWLPAMGLSRKVALVQEAIGQLEERYADLLSSRERALRQLQADNARLKRRLREMSADKTMLQDIAQRRYSRPSQQRQIVDYLAARYGLNPRQARRLLGNPLRLLPTRARRNPEATWQLDLQGRAQLWIAEGYHQVNTVLQRESAAVGKRVAYRLYVREPLKLGRKLPGRLRSTSLKSIGWLKRMSSFASPRKKPPGSSE